jgi:hypothetical protein
MISINEKKHSNFHESSVWNIGLPDTASAQVVCVAERFITTLSKTGSPSICFTSHKSEFISSEERDALARTLTPEIVGKLMNKQPEGTLFYKVGSGNHNTVWGHPNYPNLVFKLMDQKKADHQVQVAQKAYEVTQQQNNCWVQIPRASSINVGEVAVYIEERLLLGLNEEQHQEFWARVLAYYQSSECSDEFKTHLQALVGQIQLLVEKVGIWDVGYKNLPEVRTDGKGVCGTDFEGVGLNGVGQTAMALERLAHMLPVDLLVNDIVKGYEQQVHYAWVEKFEQYTNAGIQELAPTKESMCLEFHSALKKERERLKGLQDAIQIYDAKDDIHGMEALLYNCDLSLLNKDEKELAWQLLSDCAEQFFKTNNKKNTASERHCLFVQPCIKYNNCYTHERFLNVLNVLKEQNIVINWNDDCKNKSTEEDRDLVGYNIRFSTCIHPLHPLLKRK